MNGFVPGLGFDNEAYGKLASPQTSFGVRLSMRDKRTPKDVCGEANASRKGLFNFVLLLSHACNLQTAQSQTSVVNDTLYSSKFHFSGDLVTELRPTLNENISLFFFSVASHIPYLFHLVSLLVSTGPPTIRASIHGLVINIIQSLCTCTCIKFSGESSWIWYFMIFFRFLSAL